MKENETKRELKELSANLEPNLQKLFYLEKFLTT